MQFKLPKGFGFLKQNLENEPINCVDWDQARVFANWMGGDLLSEAEWEYVARSQGFNQNYPWGNDAPNCLRSIFQLTPLQNCSPNTAIVCSLRQGDTLQGVCDMAGNVWEWVLDEYHSNYIGAPIDQQAWCIDLGTCRGQANPVNRVVRGGAWNSDFSHIRVYYRQSKSQTYKGAGYGIRMKRMVHR